MYLTFHSHKPEVPREYTPEQIDELIQMDWFMTTEDYACVFLWGVVVGAGSMFLYTVFH